MSNSGSYLIDYCNQELWRRRGHLVVGAYLQNSTYAEDLLSHLPELNARFPALRTSSINKEHKNEWYGDVIVTTFMYFWLREDFKVLGEMCMYYHVGDIV